MASSPVNYGQVPAHWPKELCLGCQLSIQKKNFQKNSKKVRTWKKNEKLPTLCAEQILKLAKVFNNFDETSQLNPKHLL